MQAVTRPNEQEDQVIETSPAMSGVPEHGDRLVSPKAYIGKRKRTSSSESKSESIGKVQSDTTQQELEKILRSMQSHDTTGYILKHELPPRSTERILKRQRTNSSNAPVDNIESRVLDGTYLTVHELEADFMYLKDRLSQETEVNGHMAQLDVIEALFLETETKPDPIEKPRMIIANGVQSDKEEMERSVAQILSLRSQTESGVKQLFSGLPQSTDGSVSDFNGRKLPNGFELTAVTMMDRSKKPSKEYRTFGEVFAPHRNTKTLEAPRPDRRHRDISTLNFVPPYSIAPSAVKPEHKQGQFDLGLWLEYSADGSQPPPHGSTRKTKAKKETPISLFRAAFSSFAPTTDHSKSVVTDADRSRGWYQKYTTMNTLLDLPEVNQDDKQVDEIMDFHPDEGFEEMLDNFVSESDVDDMDESEKLLNEVSELLETLCSYQVIRDSEHARGPSSANKPTKQEVDVYDMLKSQLKILVNNLPPYAVAKLNGDQLESLNISTNLLVVPPEFLGTSHADEYTLRRAKAAQVTTTAATRPNPANSTRNNYATPASAYNTQAYNRNAPATAYAARQGTTAYNTPRVAQPQAAPYSQPNYRAASAVYPNSTIQQFQRAVANGLAQPGGSAQPYMQRPPASSPQQRTDNAGTATDTNQSLTNGQVTQNAQPRQYDQAVPAMPTSTSQAELNQRTTESMKLLQQQSASLRQASGTPQPSNGNAVSQQQPLTTASIS